MHGIKFQGGEMIDGMPRGGVARFKGDMVIDVMLGREFQGEFIWENISKLVEQRSNARVLIIDQ
jgi:hypothetical protein